MPDFIHKGKMYYNPVEFALEQIGNTWKIPILSRLDEKVLRYGELKKNLPHISDKMLSQQLKQLEADGFINKKVYPVVPPKTEYSLTDLGKLSIPIIGTIRCFGIMLMEKNNIDTGHYKD